MRVLFSEVFEDNGDGSYTSKHRVKIGGITMGPGGVSFTEGVSFSGVDIASYVGRDLEVDQYEDLTVEIRGVY